MLANQLSQAATIIQQGGVIAYSTDTVLGLGCDPNNQTAVEKILWLKHRSIEKGLILLIESVHALEGYSEPLSTKQTSEILSTSSTTPTTWLLPAQRLTPVWITGAHDRVAIRITQHPIASKLCKILGAVVSTSANFSDYPIAVNAKQLRDWFGPYLDYVIIGTPGTGVPSEIRDLISGKILRRSN